MKQGMTLDEIGGLLAVHPVEAEVHHAADSSLEAFRAARGTSRPRGRVRDRQLPAQGDWTGTGGHISPLAAYDAETDRLLILDVSRYKYPPVWVTTPSCLAP